MYMSGLHPTQVTYMLQGSFQHEDFCGHRGTINPGDLQVSNSILMLLIWPKTNQTPQNRSH